MHRWAWLLLPVVSVAAAALPAGATEPAPAPARVPLTVPEQLPVAPFLLTDQSARTIRYRPVVFVAANTQVPLQDLPGVVSGTIGAYESTDLRISSATPRSNGFYIKGGSEYTLQNLSVQMSGDSTGWDDITGVGAGVLAGEGSTLVLKRAHVITRGTKSVAVTVSGGTLRVHDSVLIARGGDVPHENTLIGSGPGYVGPPEPLGIRGNARATNVVGNARAYYYDSTIIADGWGAMSTDSAAPAAYLEVNRSHVRVNNSGYGTYADNGCTVVINDSDFQSATYTGIISGTGAIQFNNTTETRAVYGVMLHAPGQDFVHAGTLGIKGGRFATREATVLVKGHNADIVIDGARLQPRNDEIIHTVINESKRSALLRWLLAPQDSTPVRGPLTGVRATLSNMRLAGKFVHEDTARTMRLKFENTQFRGAVTGSYYTITDVLVSLDARSRWSATANSRVTLLDAVDAARFDAPRGVTITAIAGSGTTLRGSYTLRSGGRLIVKTLPGAPS